MSETKEINFIDLILQIWKNKKVFFYILIPLLILSYLLDYIVPKKEILEIEIKDINEIHLDVYPSESVLSSIIIKDVTYLGPQSGFGTSNKVSLSYYAHYFQPIFLSKKALNDFSKLNKENNFLVDYLDKNKISAFKAHFGPNNYKIVLPKHPKNEIFFLNFLAYAENISFETFKVDIIRLEQSKLSNLKRDIISINKILDKSGEINNQNNTVDNLKIIKAIYKEREMILQKNINFVKDLKNIYKDSWIVDGPIKKTLNKKFYSIAKFVLPVILSLIIFLFYILIKFTRQNIQN